MAIGDTLGDYFVRTAGRISSLSLVRCGITDEATESIARGIAASTTLTYLDISGSFPSAAQPNQGAVMYRNPCSPHWYGWVSFGFCYRNQLVKFGSKREMALSPTSAFVFVEEALPSLLYNVRIPFF